MTESLPLFDQHEHPEAGCVYCLLEQWFKDYLRANKQDKQNLRRRFRSTRNSDFQGAFFELFIYRLLDKLDYEVCPSPHTPFGTPDFLATESSGDSFYCEATIVDPKELKHSRRHETLINELHKLKCPNYLLLAKDDGKLSSNPPLAKMRHHFQTWIDQTAHTEIGSKPSGSDPSCSYSHGEWTITLTALPSEQANRGKHGNSFIGLMQSFGIDSAAKLIGAAAQKARAYRKIDKPLLVAINTLDFSISEKLDVPLALFGWEQGTGEPDRVPIVPPSGTRRHDCIWDPNKNTTISAIVLFKGLQPNTVATATVCLYENPWARRPISPSLRRLPYAVVEDKHLVWKPGQALHSILGLPPRLAKTRIVSSGGLFRRRL